MLQSILVPVSIVTIIGIIAAVILVIASKVMAVKVDDTVIKLREALPGANCGACGFAGCDEYAEQMAKNSVATNLCRPGGDSTATKLSEILGKEAGEVEELTAFVKCRGNSSVTDTSMDYSGPKSCSACSTFYGGDTKCIYGCMGYGDCVEACNYDAINILDGVAVVNKENCGGCGACVKACPKGIIELGPKKKDVFVACSSKDKGAVARKLCKNACIGCKKCEKACPVGAITVENNIAHVDMSKCVNCEKCVNECPTGAILSYKKHPVKKI